MLVWNKFSSSGTNTFEAKTQVISCAVSIAHKFASPFQQAFGSNWVDHFFSVQASNVAVFVRVRFVFYIMIFHLESKISVFLFSLWLMQIYFMENEQLPKTRKISTFPNDFWVISKKKSSSPIITQQWGTPQAFTDLDDPKIRNCTNICQTLDAPKLETLQITQKIKQPTIATITA